MSKFDKFQRIFITLLIAVSFFYGGYYFGKRGFVAEIKKNPPKIEVINQAPPDQKVDFSLFWQVWNMVSQDYLERPVDGQKMIYGAISGMVASLGDPYTSFLPPDTNKALSAALNGTYTGIGAELGLKDNQLVVVAPLDGSPAKASGVLAGDKILEIDGQATAGMNLNDAVARIRGEDGTLVSLKVQRGESDPSVIRIKRGTITVSSVTWEDKGNGTAYIRISQFGDNTNAEWKKAVSEINVKMNELDVVIVDVRGNPGGYLQSAVYIADEFVPGKKPIVWEEEASGKQTPLESGRMGVLENVPQVYVLVDGGSASASEILAAALRENINAKLIGVKSFGKGTIQDAKDFKDGSGVHITIAKWLTPNKEWIHKIGLDPDIVVQRTDVEINKGIDSQLDKALELAKKL